MMVACMYGQKFSGVAFHGKQAQYYDRKAFEYGLASRHIAFGDLGIDFTEVQNAFASPQQMTERFIAESRRLVAQGAEVILAACATVNAIIRREKITEVDGALVLDCNAVLLKTAEGMADLAKSIGLTASRRRLYQQPARSALNDWMKLYGYRATPQLRPVETDTPQAKAG
jgi:Asp/Glu/hydantoin racemase